MPEGTARVSVLNLEGRPAAFCYGFAYHNKYYWFQTGFDPKLDKLSPGGVLFLLRCERLIEQGVTELDYLRGDHAYKTNYGDDARHTKTVRVFRRRGAAYLQRWHQTHVIAKLRAWAKANLRKAETSEGKA
jgi:CelD/BcsL family acetyltransferase involved in cellulose biosynthesis